MSKIYSGFTIDPAAAQKIVAERGPSGNVILKQGNHTIVVPAADVAQFQRAVASMKEVVT